MQAQFVTAQEVAEIMGVSRSKAYQIVREMNRELKSMGYITVSGKCPVQYFKKKFYGLQIGGDSICGLPRLHTSRSDSRRLFLN